MSLTLKIHMFRYVGGASTALAVSLGLSAAVGGWGLFVTELLEDSFQIQGMAESGMMPRFLECVRCFASTCRQL